MSTNPSLVLDDLLPLIANQEREHPEAYPESSIRALFDAGIIAGPFPEDLGGRGMKLADSVRALEATASASPSVALIASMPLGLAGIYGLGSQVAPDAHRSAFAEQTSRVAADYRAGRLYAACNSEKGAGGSLAATQTTAARQSDGAFVLSGEKILASAGRNAATFFSTAKVSADELPGAGIVEFFLVDVATRGVEVSNDWDGFGMRSTESHTVRYTKARAREIVGFPDFVNLVQPLEYWFCLFAAIPLGCAKAILRATASPAPQSPALRLRFAEATMRYEAMRAYQRGSGAARSTARNGEYVNLRKSNLSSPALCPAPKFTFPLRPRPPALSRTGGFSHCAPRTIAGDVPMQPYVFAVTP